MYKTTSNLSFMQRIIVRVLDITRAAYNVRWPNGGVAAATPEEKIKQVERKGPVAAKQVEQQQMVLPLKEALKEEEVGSYRKIPATPTSRKFSKKKSHTRTPKVKRGFYKKIFLDQGVDKLLPGGRLQVTVPASVNKEDMRSALSGSVNNWFGKGTTYVRSVKGEDTILCGRY